MHLCGKSLFRMGDGSLTALIAFSFHPSDATMKPLCLVDTAARHTLSNFFDANSIAFYQLSSRRYRNTASRIAATPRRNSLPCWTSERERFRDSASQHFSLLLQGANVEDMACASLAVSSLPNMDSGHGLYISPLASCLTQSHSVTCVKGRVLANDSVGCMYLGNDSTARLDAGRRAVSSCCCCGG